jgi:hypothetical protein
MINKKIPGPWVLTAMLTGSGITHIHNSYCGLFLTWRGEKYTVLIQQCTIYNKLNMWVFKGKNP